MSKRHQATRRRSYGRRQHELHERTDRATDPLSWLDDADDLDEYVVAFGSERVQLGSAGWARSRGLE